MGKKYYYKISEAGDYIERRRRGLSAAINIYELDNIKNGYWPIYYDHTAKFAETEKKAREIMFWLQNRSSRFLLFTENSRLCREFKRALAMNKNSLW